MESDLEHVLGEDVATAISSRMLPKLRHVRDIIEYEGPLLSEFIGPNNESWVYYWVASGATFHRWLVCRALKSDLLTEKDMTIIVLRALFHKSQYLGPRFIVDLDNDADVQAAWRLNGAVPDKYLP